VISSPKTPRPPNSPDLNPLDYHVWEAMLERYRFHKPNFRNKVELKVVLKGIWADLPQAPNDKAILAFWKKLEACVNADGGHFEHQQYCSNCHSQPSSALFRATKIIQKESQHH
jgi:hypothetical protein